MDMSLALNYLSLRWAQYGLNSGKISHEPNVVAL